MLLNQIGINQKNDVSKITHGKSKNHSIIKMKDNCPREKSKVIISDSYFLNNITIKIKKNNPFIWDGSHLGTLVKGNIVHLFNHNDKIFCILSLYGHETFCQIKEIKTNCPSVCDELKTIFHITKLGTHRVNCDNKLYLLISSPGLVNGYLEDGVWKSKCSKNFDLSNSLHISYLLSLNNNDMPLSCFYNINDGDFIISVQNMFLFRDILGLNWSFERSIIVRQKGEELVPISFYENSVSMETGKKIIPETILNKWFDDITLDDAAKRVFDIKKEEDVLNKLSSLRAQINSVIERIDKTMIFLTDIIIEKLSRRFLTDLRPPITPTWN